jgi:hypothetical protein
VNTELFSESWIAQLGHLWNTDEKMLKHLRGVDFNAVVGYGFKGEEAPRVYLEVSRGQVVHTGVWDGLSCNWDLRADLASWEKWIRKGFGLQRLGAAVVSGELQFFAGDYRQMVSRVSLSVPFLRHFELMQAIGTEFEQ